MYWCNLIREIKTFLEEFGFGFMISQKTILKTKGNSENRADFLPSIKGAKKKKRIPGTQAEEHHVWWFFRCLPSLHTNETKWSEKIIESSWKIFNPCRKGKITATIATLHPSPPCRVACGFGRQKTQTLVPFHLAAVIPSQKPSVFWGWHVMKYEWDHGMGMFNMNPRLDYKGSRIPFQYWFSFGHWNSNATDSIHTGSQHLIVIICFGNSVQCSWPQPVVQQPVQPWTTKSHAKVKTLMATQSLHHHGLTESDSCVLHTLNMTPYDSQNIPELFVCSRVCGFRWDFPSLTPFNYPLIN